MMWPESAAETVGRYTSNVVDFGVALLPGSSLPQVGAEAGQGNYGTAVLLLGTELLGPLGKGARAIGAAEKTAYSVVFETAIEKTGKGLRPEHKFLANRGLAEAMSSSKELSQTLSKLGVQFPMGRNTPVGFQWHHAVDRPGVMPSGAADAAGVNRTLKFSRLSVFSCTDAGLCIAVSARPHLEHGVKHAMVMFGVVHDPDGLPTPAFRGNDGGLSRPPI